MEIFDAVWFGGGQSEAGQPAGAPLIGVEKGHRYLPRMGGRR
jgi:hypothetical protein